MLRACGALLLLLIFVAASESYKILVVFPVPSHSHYTLGVTLAKGLADKGHQVTFVNPYPTKTDLKNVRQVDLEGVIEFVEEQKKILFDIEKQHPLVAMMTFNYMMANTTELILNTPSFQKLLNSKEQFDVVVMEFFMNEAALGLGPHFGAHTVAVTSTGASILNSHLVANPLPSSYIPHLASAFTKHMTFYERLQNLMMNTVGTIVRDFIMARRHAEIHDSVFTKSGIKFCDSKKNISLVLTNSHVSVNDAVPHVPNMIEVGGYHVVPPKPLPADLQDFLDKATEGVVLFSMGSNLKSKDLKPAVKDAILKSFAKIKQKVLWKFETELDNLPANVRIMKWLPQNDILAHKNIKAFITHGGLLSSLETIYHGVPVIVIPVFGDQKGNAAAAVSNGYAVTIPLTEISEATMTAALNEVLNNPKYIENARLRSKIMHDQPMKPMESAIYWIEYVVRHNGAAHLRSAALDLSWAQQNMLDVFAFLLGITAAAIFVTTFVIKKLLGCFKRNPKVSTSKKRQ